MFHFIYLLIFAKIVLRMKVVVL